MSRHEEILALAGITKEKRAELEAKRVARIDEALDATKVERVTYQGEVLATFDDVDHATRLAAADRVARMNGTEQSKSASDQGKDTRPIIVIIERDPGPQVVEVIEPGS